MEIREKYYNIVVELVKNHRKYAGCEDILDDIVEDVLEHSKVVLNSVANDTVVSAYLNKVVSTSIITVPRRLNVKMRPKTNVVEILELARNKEQAAFEVEEPSFVQESGFEDEVFNSISELVVEQDDIVVEEKTIEPSEFVDETTNIEVEVLEEVSDELSENVVESVEDEDSLFSEEAPEQIAEPESKDVDMSLVEKMINGVSEEEIIGTKDVLIEDSENNALNDVELLEEEVTIDNAEEVDSEQIELEEFEEETTLLEETSAIESLDIINNDFEEDNEIVTVDDSVEENSLSEFVMIDEDEKIIEGILDESAEIVESKEDTIIATGNLKLYDRFNYEPETYSYDFCDEISDMLLELNSKKPHLKIVDVCTLKYTEGKSVSEISNILELSESSVLESLNEIVELVKD